MKLGGESYRPSVRVFAFFPSSSLAAPFLPSSCFLPSPSRPVAPPSTLIRTPTPTRSAPPVHVRSRPSRGLCPHERPFSASNRYFPSFFLARPPSSNPLSFPAVYFPLYYPLLYTKTSGDRQRYSFMTKWNIELSLNTVTVYSCRGLSHVPLS